MTLPGQNDDIGPSTKSATTLLLGEKETLKIFKSGFEPETVDLKVGMGYEFEIRSFVDEILSGINANIDLINQAAETIAIIEDEKVSIEACSVVTIKF